MKTGPAEVRHWTTGAGVGLKLCLSCHKVCAEQTTHCPRCGARVYQRRQNSIARSWALTLTAALLYIPANLLPMMTVSKFEEGQPQTIFSGVIELINQGMVPIALLVFTASVLVPVLKLLGMVWLLSLCPVFQSHHAPTADALPGNRLDRALVNAGYFYYFPAGGAGAVWKARYGYSRHWCLCFCQCGSDHHAGSHAV